MATLLGGDFSSWQGDIDWDTYKNNSNFAIIRSTYGNGYTDTKFIRNKNEARRVGLLHGFYHYSYPQYNSAEAEADWMLSQIDIQDGEMLCLDYEENWSGDKVKWCTDFLDHVSSHLNGYKPLIYLNQSLITSNNWQPLIDKGYGLWCACYTYNPTINTCSIGQWPFMAMQQWTSSQQVAGIVGNTDGDVFFGDRDTFLKYAYKAPVQNPPTIPPPEPPPPPPMPPVPDCCGELELTKIKLEEANNKLANAAIKLGQIKSVVDDKWTWFGRTNSWKIRLNQLKTLLM